MWPETIIKLRRSSAASGPGIFPGVIAPIVRPACQRRTMPPLFRRCQPWSGSGCPLASAAACQRDARMKVDAPRHKFRIKNVQ
jgi:hypothetical protein